MVVPTAYGGVFKAGRQVPDTVHIQCAQQLEISTVQGEKKENSIWNAFCLHPVRVVLPVVGIFHAPVSQRVSTLP